MGIFHYSTSHVGAHWDEWSKGWIACLSQKEWVASLVVIQTVSRTAPGALSPQRKAFSAVIISTRGAVAIVVQALSTVTRIKWHTLAIAVCNISIFALIAEVPDLRACLAVVINTWGAVAIVIPALSTATLIALLLDALLPVAGAPVTIVTLVACPSDNSTIAVGWLRWGAAGDGVSAVRARHGNHGRRGDKEQGQAREDARWDVHSCSMKTCGKRLMLFVILDAFISRIDVGGNPIGANVSSLEWQYSRARRNGIRSIVGTVK